jgi:anaerobic magnesium-protoporphyrin IX monomethyl ester cyclase
MKITLIGAECEENLAIRYIRASLEAKGHQVTQIVFNSIGDLESAAQQIANSQSELAGMSMVFTYRAREFARLAARSRELGFRGHLTAGGHFAAFNCRELLRDVPAFDSIAIGEGEDLMCHLAENLGDLSRVPGLVWRDTAGQICQNPPAQKPARLDRLPLPTRLEPPDTFFGLPIANMLASRGCTHSCNFCSISAWHKLCRGPRLRLREPAAIAEEMAALYARGYRIFNFHDDNFFLPNQRKTLQRFWRLRGELESLGVGKIAFAVKSRPDTVDEETFAFLKEFGLFRVFLGIEAGTGDSLQHLGRGITPGQNERALEIVNRLDLHATFNLLLLNPDSTLEDFRANVAFLRNHADNPMNFCRTEVYSGTPLEQKLRSENRLQGDYWGYNYTIRDARAETAFRLIYLGMGKRHVEDDCVHHLTMRVDYERQLLAHFWNCPDTLRSNAKDFIRRVNLNTCDYLDEIANAAQTGFATTDAQQQFIRNMLNRIGLENDRFTSEGLALVTEFNRASQPEKRSRNWQQDAAALLVSSLALTGNAYAGSGYFNEISARPHTNEPPLPAPAPQTNHPAIPESSLMHGVIGLMAVKSLAMDMPRPGADVELEIKVDAEGKMTLQDARKITAIAITPLSITNLPNTQDVLTNRTIPLRELLNKTWNVRFTEKEITTAAQSLPPQPRTNRPPTQIFEVRAMPPQSTGAGSINDMRGQLPALQTNQAPSKEPTSTAESIQPARAPRIFQFSGGASNYINAIAIMALTPALAVDIPKPYTDIELDIQVDSTGKSMLIAARKITTNSTIQLPLSSLPKTQEAIKNQSFTVEGVMNKTWTRRFTVEELTHPFPIFRDSYQNEQTARPDIMRGNR